MNDERRRELAREIRETAPRAPGVYALLDAGGRLLYVGKSVNLRHRMASYFSRDPFAAEPHLGRLSTSVGSFAWWRTTSELLALLLEDVLIKEHLPPYNTRLKEMAESRYLELTNDEYPACLVVGHATSFGTREVFGPLKDKYFAALLQGIIHETLGVRTCGEPEPIGRCLDYDIGRCSGPCRGTVKPGEYGDLVTKARDFLSGNAEEVASRLARARDIAAAAMRYEEAARLRDAIDTCRRYETHQKFARRFTEEDCFVRCDEDGIEYRFSRGALVEPRNVVVANGHAGLAVDAAGTGFQPEAEGRGAVAALRRPPSSDRRLLADRTRIVCNWVRRQGEGRRVLFDGVEGRVPADELRGPTE